MKILLSILFLVTLLLTANEFSKPKKQLRKIYQEHQTIINEWEIERSKKIIRIQANSNSFIKLSGVPE